MEQLNWRRDVVFPMNVPGDKADVHDFFSLTLISVNHTSTGLMVLPKTQGCIMEKPATAEV